MRGRLLFLLLQRQGSDSSLDLIEGSYCIISIQRELSQHIERALEHLLVMNIVESFQATGVYLWVAIGGQGTNNLTSHHGRVIIQFRIEYD